MRFRPLLVLVLAGLALRAAAGPSLACPDGVDPLRFRAELPIAAVADEPEPIAIAAALDRSTGSETVALAYLTPAHEVALVLSTDGGCTFGAPDVVSPAGSTITQRPAVALRMAGGPLLVVGWLDGSSVLVRAASSLTGGLGAAIRLDDSALGPPRLAMTQEGGALVAAAWLHDAGAGLARPRVATTASSADRAAWGTPTELDPGSTAADAEIACDLAGASGGPGASLLVALPGGRALLSRLDDPAIGWSALRRIDDGGRSDTALGAVAASAGAGPQAWTAVAWIGSGGDVAADSALQDTAAMASDFDGLVSLQAASLASSGAGGRPALAVLGAAPGAELVAAFASGGEIELARRPLADTRPRLQGGCGPTAITGVSPIRQGGIARAPAAAGLGDDVVLAFADDRGGAPQVFFKRSDSANAPVALTNAVASACGDAPRVDLTWSAPPCDAVMQVVEVGAFAGDTAFTRTIAPGGGLSIEGLEPASQYFFRVRTIDDAGNESLSNEVSALTPDCSLVRMQAAIATLTDDCAAGGPGGGDGRADPGENLHLQVTFTNDGTAPAPTPRVRILSRSGFLTVRTPPRDLPSIAPSLSQTVTFDLDLSATAPCGAAIPLLARSDSGGAAWADLLEIDVPATCTPCRLPGCAMTADASRTLPRAFCSGDGTTLDGGASTSASCAGVPVYEWYVGNQLVGTGMALTQAPSASVAYRLVVRCSTDLACFDEDVVDVVVHPLPIVTIEQDPPGPHCMGDAVELVAVTSDPAATFLWNDGRTTARRPVSGPGLWSVNVTDSNGCRGSRATRLDYAEIPPADAGPDVAGCGAQRIGTPAYPLLDYQWSPPDGLSDPRAPQPWASPATPTTYTLTVTDPLSGCSATDDVTVSSTPGPGPIRALRVTRTPALLRMQWEGLPGTPLVRAYGETDASRAGGANATSPTARLLCEDASGECAVALPSDSLLFIQAVAACPDGVHEGPNG